MRLITEIKDLKRDYLYQITDSDNSYIVEDVYVTGSAPRGDLRAILVYVIKFTSKVQDVPSQYFNMSTTVLSQVRIDSSEFNDMNYEFLEVGPKSEYPEYFL